MFKRRNYIGKSLLELLRRDLVGVQDRGDGFHLRRPLLVALVLADVVEAVLNHDFRFSRQRFADLILRVFSALDAAPRARSREDVDFVDSLAHRRLRTQRRDAGVEGLLKF